MTICVAIRVNDGIVFAADSASSLTQGGSGSVLNVYRHGNKVFNLFKGLPLAGMTCGIGNFGPASIASLAKDLRYRMTHGGHEWRLNAESYTLEEVVTRSRDFFLEKFNALEHKPTGDFEFWVGGYPSDMEAPYELWKLGIAGGDFFPPERISEPGEPGVAWAGAPDPISRLLIGFDSTMISALEMALAKRDDAGTLTEVPDLAEPLRFIRVHTEVQLAEPMMPIHDAMELAEFLVDTTKKFYRFLPGADIVGGDTDMATVTRHEGFKWIKRKHYYDRALNRTGVDHV
jgi:hypothetical protein